MRNVFGRRRRKECGSCGFPVPIYPGRYPNRCPDCGELFEPVAERRKLREASYPGSDGIVDYMISPDNDSPAPPQAPDSSTAVGILVDQVMQRINVLGLLDYFVGVTYEITSPVAWFFFSKQVKINVLEKLSNDIRSAYPSVALKRLERDDADWALAVSAEEGGANAPIPDDSQVVEIEGDFEVAGKGASVQPESPQVPQT